MILGEAIMNDIHSAGRSETIFDPETLRVGDRVRHADRGDATAVIKQFWGYPLATVRWESTGRESTENFYYLIKVED